MKKPLDPYFGNILTAGLGPLRAKADLMKVLTTLPPAPPNMEGLPPHVALHLLMSVRSLHIPAFEEVQLHTTTDLMVRQNYQFLDPRLPETWGAISGDHHAIRMMRPPSFGAAVVGISGTGKSEAIHRCLMTYPSQVIQHSSFPNMVNGHSQVVWLSTDVPPSGSTIDLATSLMWAWCKATGSNRFMHELTSSRRNGMQMLDSWRQVACSHFLGLLHLDEIQNLFKLPTLKARSKRGITSARPELSVADDKALKWILTLLNTWQVPLLVSGTEDGLHALTRRLSTTQRLVTSGFHTFKRFESIEQTAFRFLLKQLGQYQFVKKKLPVDDLLASVMLELTAGVPRLIIAIWIAAHRVALERATGDLRVDDFKKAARTFLAPVMPAVSTLLSNDPIRMLAYEDLMPAEDKFWDSFWNSVSRI